MAAGDRDDRSALADAVTVASGPATDDASGDSLASPGGDSTIDPLLRAVARTPAIDVHARLTRPGARIARFEVERVLGEGGMGVVVAAHDPTLDRRVAIKLLRATDPSAAARTRLIREAQAAARVEHEHVIAIHEVATVGELVFVVMEMIDGETLTRWQRQRPWREVLAAYLRAGRGLAAAHDAALVHRDFKPDNVLVGRDGRLRVTDFGLVAASGTIFDDDGRIRTDSAPPAPALQVPLTRTGDVMGTPAYMAPEQYRGEAADARADQFSFCVALWEGLYGVRPFDAGTLAERHDRILRGDATGPRPGRGVPARFEAILRRGLAGDPAARWPDMGALLAALADDPEARRARRRRAAIAIGGAATAAAAVAVAGVMLLGAGEAPPPCRGLDRQLDGVWDPARRAVRRTQSAELLDRRMACLDRRQAELATTVGVLVDDAAASLPRALDAVTALPPLDRCDGERLVGAPAPPADPATTTAIVRARSELDLAAALGRAGRWKDAREPAAAAVTAARAIAWPPLIAEALAVDARARLITGDPKGAQEALHAGIAAASAAGDAALQAQLTVGLVEIANREARYADVATLAALAEATLGADDARWAERATLAAEQGRAARAQQQLEVARGHLERALALRTKHAGPDSALAARSIQDLGNLELAAARWPEAEARFRQALAIVERAAGPDHPDVAVTLGRLAVTAKEQDRLDEAAALLRRSTAILTAAEGDDSPSVATSWANLGVVLGEQGRGEEALAAYQKALAVREKVLPPDHPDLGSSILNVGVALQENLGRPAEALPYFERARDLLRQKLGPDHPTLAFARHGVGAARLDLGQAAAAVPELDDAYRIRSSPNVDPGLRTETGRILARALWASGVAGSAARRRAVEVARATRQALVELGAPADPWIDAHAR